ncbi:MAG TPA: hypothetical protein VLH94_03090 [Spirochaetia bacterium]|nr:hypothetical protein [Spirochaetia bacterium]
MIENEGRRSFMKKVIGAGVALGLGVGGVFGGAKSAEAHSSQTIDNEPAATAPLGSAEVQKGDSSVSPVVERVTNNPEKEVCEAGCELQEILSKELEIDDNGRVKASLKDFSQDRSLGEIYHDPNGVLNVDTTLQVDYPIDGRVVTKEIKVTNKASVAGYYQAPDGLWYKIRVPEPKVEE